MHVEGGKVLGELLKEQRVLALSVLVDGEPYVGLLPYVIRPDFSAVLIQASDLAHHTKGLESGAPFAALIHQPQGSQADVQQLPRVTLQGTVRPLLESSPALISGRQLYLAKFPTSERTFALADFKLYELVVTKGRFIAGFGSVATLTPAILQQLAREASSL